MGFSSTIFQQSTRKFIYTNHGCMTSPIFALQTERMSSEQFKSMQELVEELNQYLAAIDEGTGDVDRLQEMVDNARELYERLVVMRHKAFEETVHEVEEETTAPEPAAEPEVEPEDTFQEAIPFSLDAQDIEEVEEEPEEKEEEVVEIIEEEPTTEEKIEPFAEPEPEPEVVAVPENQTSLIDAIEEINGESVAEKYASEDDSESLVEKLEKAPIKDLVKAINLNQKFQFIKELFDGDNERYLAEIESFNNMDSWGSAKNVLGSLNDELSWEEGEAKDEFTELIQRRYSAQA